MVESDAMVLIGDMSVREKRTLEFWRRRAGRMELDMVLVGSMEEGECSEED